MGFTGYFTSEIDMAEDGHDEALQLSDPGLVPRQLVTGTRAELVDGLVHSELWDAFAVHGDREHRVIFRPAMTPEVARRYAEQILSALARRR